MLSSTQPSTASCRTPLFRSSIPCRFAKSRSRHLARAAAEQPRVADGDLVSVHYTGTLDDGKVFDTSKAEGRAPLDFCVGSGTVIKGFDLAVTGLAVGETNQLRVNPEDAYGEQSDELKMTVPKEKAPEGVVEGALVQLSIGLPARVVSVTDAEVTIDVNHPLAGLHLTFEVELLSLTKGASLRKATFGAGCFWGPELAFQRVPGVVSTEVGYSNGHVESPTYEEVCSGTTGHSEVTQVLYNVAEVSYESLLDTFWATLKDPTQRNAQGADTGTQYRTGIYYHTPAQKAAAEASLAVQQEKYQGQVATEVVEVSNYYKAEDYHQRYLARGGGSGNAQNAAKGCTDEIRCYG